MNNPYTTISGDRAKLLRQHPHRPQTEAVTTLTADAGVRVAQILNEEVRFGCGESGLVRDAEQTGAEPAWCRRRLLNAFDGTAHGAGSAAQGHAENLGVTVKHAVKDEPDAVVRAIRDELGRLYANLDGVLVTAEVYATFWTPTKTQLVVNDWLEKLAENVTVDEEILREDEFLFEMLFDYEDTIYRHLDVQSSFELVDLAVELDEDRARAWCEARR